MNKIYFYDILFLIVFTLAIVAFLYLKRKNLQKEGIMYLYRTKIGLKYIDNVGKKYPRTIKILSYVSIFVGYLLFLASIYFVASMIYVFSKPDFVKAIRVPPIVPLVPYLPELFKIDILPPFYFSYWIIAIALIALFHEGAHGVFARFHKVRIKSTGFGFLGPFLAFFVEQDDKQMQKSSTFSQLSILSAGVFLNTLLAIFFFLMLGLFVSSAYDPGGAIFTGYTYSVMPLNNSNLTILSETLLLGNITYTKLSYTNTTLGYKNLTFYSDLDSTKDGLALVYFDYPAFKNQVSGIIDSVDSSPIKTSKDISRILETKKPGDNITLTTFKIIKGEKIAESYNLVLGTDFRNNSRPVIGILSSAPSSWTFKGLFYKIASNFQDPSVYYEPRLNKDLSLYIYNLIWWLAWINLSVAIVNILPLGVFDGGRFFYLTVLGITRNKKLAEKAFKSSTWILLFIIALLMVFWFFGIFIR